MASDKKSKTPKYVSRLESQKYKRKELVQESCRNVETISENLGMRLTSEQMKSKKMIYPWQCKRPTDEVLLDTDQFLYRRPPPSRPRFLAQLKQFIQRAVKEGNLDLDPITAADAKLQVYREALNALVFMFSTFRPLLNEVREAYECSLKVRDDMLSSLQNEKDILQDAEQRFAERLQTARTEGGDTNDFLRRERLINLRRIDQLEEGRYTQQNIIEKLELELEEEHRRRIDEGDARRLLVADLSDMRQQLEILRRRVAEGSSAKPEDDPIILRTALLKCREDLSIANRHINEMVADYGDVVPRRDFDSLESQHKSMQKQMRIATSALETLRHDHRVALDTLHDLQQEREALATENMDLRRSATPRPDWDKVAEFIDGGMSRWIQITGGRTSVELLDLVLSELTNTEVTSAVSEYFPGLGSGDNVPSYLRCEGPVLNRRLGRRDVGFIVRDIWRKRSMSMDLPLSDFVGRYFAKSFPEGPLRWEWSYGTVDACRRLTHVPRLGIFLAILEGGASEDIWLWCQNKCNVLWNILKENEKEEDILNGIKQEFPTKPTEFVEELLLICMQQRKFASDDKEEAKDAVLDEIIRQDWQEREHYSQQVSSKLREKVMPDDLRKALSVIDPHIDKPQMESVVQWIFVDVNKPTNSQAVAKKILLGNIRRTGPTE